MKTLHLDKSLKAGFIIIKYGLKPVFFLIKVVAILIIQLIQKESYLGINQP